MSEHTEPTHPASHPSYPPGVAVRGRLREGYELVLTRDALQFVSDLQRKFGPDLERLLAERQDRARRLRDGEPFDFLEETRAIRASDWEVAPLPADLQDRRVEITGPVDRKMIINALNSGAQVFMADFEDASSPTWDNMVSGQRNLFDAVRRRIHYVAPEGGKEYRLADKVATLLVRPRGLHLLEKHLEIDGQPARGCFFDFGLFVFHNAKEQIARGTGPYFYLPKMESYLEARLYESIFTYAESALGIAKGTIKATVLIETLPAAFQMDEILYELREHSAGLNCGRWDYIFSFIKKTSHEPAAVLPDRAQITMDKGFLRAYAELLIRTCHRRNVHAMGGMAAQIPVKNDAGANEAAIEKVRADKLREVKAGHDGTWVAHPALVPVARAIFDAHMPGPNQIEKKRDDVSTVAADLLAIPEGTKTEAGLRQNMRVGVQYIEAWLRGSGAVPIYNLMEDAATAEISRAQVWQWIHHGACLQDGRQVTSDLFATLLREEMQVVRKEVGEARYAQGRFTEASAVFARLCTDTHFEEFLTVPAYERLLSSE